MAGNTSLLRIHKTITSLQATRLKRRGREVLLVGTATDFLAHDLLKNADVFYREVRQRVFSKAYLNAANDGVVRLFLADARWRSIHRRRPIRPSKSTMGFCWWLMLHPGV